MRNISVLVLVSVLSASAGHAQNAMNLRSSVHYTDDPTGMTASRAQLHAIRSQLGARLDRIEEAMGESRRDHPLAQRTAILEKEILGESRADVATALSIEERIYRLEGKVTEVAKRPRVSLSRPIAGLIRPNVNVPINAPVVGLSKPIGVETGYSSPGRYFGYPYNYYGQGLPPQAYGAFPGNARWWGSPYQQSGLPFSTSYPFFPWAANRNGTTNFDRMSSTAVRYSNEFGAFRNNSTFF